MYANCRVKLPSPFLMYLSQYKKNTLGQNPLGQKRPAGQTHRTNPTRAKAPNPKIQVRVK